MAERGVLLGVGGDCKTPLGAYAERNADRMRLRAFMAQPDGTQLRVADQTLPWPGTGDEAHSEGEKLGRSLVSGADFRNK
jgi:hydroxymethylbilane synthase